MRFEKNKSFGGRQSRRLMIQVGAIIEIVRDVVFLNGCIVAEVKPVVIRMDLVVDGRWKTRVGNGARRHSFVVLQVAG